MADEFYGLWVKAIGDDAKNPEYWEAMAKAAKLPDLTIGGSLFEFVLVRFHVVRKEFLVRWLLDPEADHFPRKRIVSFAVLANFNVLTNKRNSVCRPCANVYQVSPIVLLFAGTIAGGLHRVAQWSEGIGWLKLSKRHAHWRVATLQF